MIFVLLLLVDFVQGLQWQIDLTAMFLSCPSIAKITWVNLRKKIRKILLFNVFFEINIIILLNLIATSFCTLKNGVYPSIEFTLAKRLNTGSIVNCEKIGVAPCNTNNGGTGTNEFAWNLPASGIQQVLVLTSLRVFLSHSFVHLLVRFIILFCSIRLIRSCGVMSVDLQSLRIENFASTLLSRAPAFHTR